MTLTDIRNDPATDIRIDPATASRYLADQLTEAERIAYEARLVEDPEMVAELEATARLKIGLHRLRRTGELAELLHEGPRFSRSVSIALAASVAAAVIGIAIWRPALESRQTALLASSVGALKDQTGHTLPLRATQSMFRARAEAYDATIVLPPTRGAIEIRVLPSKVVESARYEASLSRIRDDDTGQHVTALENLQPSADDGFVSVYADTASLTPGRYRLVLTRQAAGKAAVETDAFVIKVVSPAQDDGNGNGMR
jgi:hypothetical protein